jgi:hypothetical protein
LLVGKNFTFVLSSSLGVICRIKVGDTILSVDGIEVAGLRTDVRDLLINDHPQVTDFIAHTSATERYRLYDLKSLRRYACKCKGKAAFYRQALGDSSGWGV